MRNSEHVWANYSAFVKLASIRISLHANEFTALVQDFARAYPGTAPPRSARDRRRISP